VGPWCKPIPTEDDPLVCIAIGMHIRLTLAKPPDNRPLHNPDNLTAEQVGAGWRLLVVGEKQPKGYEYWTTKKWLSGNAIGETVDECNKDTTCRVPLSTPWPEASKPDPYAELEAAHAAGKVIQVKGSSCWHDWVGHRPPAWRYPVETYRIKPDYQLPLTNQFEILTKVHSQK